MTVVREEWFENRIVERDESNGDGTGTRTVYDAKGEVESVEELFDLPVTDHGIDTVEDPLAAEVAALRSQNEALIAALDAAKVIDAEAVRATAVGSKADDQLVLTVAKLLGADPDEVRKKRDADPQWWADVLAKYGLSSKP